jgi:hypothetical protein
MTFLPLFGGSVIYNSFLFWFPPGTGVALVRGGLLAAHSDL